MASPLVVTEIEANPDIPISRNLPDEATLVPKVYSKIWDSTNPKDFLDDTAPDGSLTPVGFFLDGVPQMRLTGFAIYPQEWQGRLNPVLVGYLDDSVQTPIISAKIGEVDLPARNAPFGPLNFSVAQMEFAEPLDPKIESQSPVPYRIAGDFRWKLTCPDKQFAPIPSTIHTRLEFYWLKTYAASGPLTAQLSMSETKLDMQGKYPVSVLRYFLPSPADLNTDVGLVTLPTVWWANYVITRKITGVKYNAIDGRAGYGVGCCGGSFSWLDWCAKVNPYVNSFDLAALVQAGMGLLSTRNFFDYDSVLRWVCHTPDGFLQTSMPFGWAGSVDPDTSAGVNNPFFLGLTRSFAPHLPDPTAVPDCAPSARVWLEIGGNEDLNGTCVIDTTFDVIPQGQNTYEPDIAKLGRTAYLKTHLSKADGGDVTAMDNGVSSPAAACYSNNMFGTSQSGYNTTPPTIARVGLTNLSGANEPKFGPNGPAPVPLMPMPPRIRQDIANAVAANRVIGARWMYNDASLKSKNVMPVLTEGTQFTRDKYWVSVAKGVSVVTYLLGNVPLAGTTIGRICVKVHVYNDFHGSTEALALELSKFESKLSAVLNPRVFPPTTGNYCVRTRSSVIFVRGNLLVDITFLGTVAVDNEPGKNYDAAEYMAHRLDTYLSARQVMSTQVRRPSLVLEVPQPPQVNGVAVVGERFEVTMAHPELLADECVSRSSIGRVLLCTGPPAVADQTDRKFGFLALSLDFPHVAQDTVVTIVGAHPNTYHPGFWEFTVRVTPQPQ